MDGIENNICLILGNVLYNAFIMSLLGIHRLFSVC